MAQRPPAERASVIEITRPVSDMVKSRLSEDERKDICNEAVKIAARLVTLQQLAVALVLSVMAAWLVSWQYSANANEAEKELAKVGQDLKDRDVEHQTATNTLNTTEANLSAAEEKLGEAEKRTIELTGEKKKLEAEKEVLVAMLESLIGVRNIDNAPNIEAPSSLTALIRNFSEKVVEGYSEKEKTSEFKLESEQPE